MYFQPVGVLDIGIFGPVPTKTGRWGTAVGDAPSIGDWSIKDTTDFINVP